MLSEVQNKNVSASEPDPNVGGVDLGAAVAPVTVKSHSSVFSTFSSRSEFIQPAAEAGKQTNKADELSPL